MSITTPDGRKLLLRRKITFVDGRTEIFFTNDGTGFPRFDEAGNVLNYFHRDGRVAVFCAPEVKRFAALPG